MNRRELVNAVATHLGEAPREVDRVLKGMTDVITGVVSKGEQVTVSGFAKFVKQERAARMGRNPATGEPIKIKASKRAKITPLKGFKDAVLTPAQAPKLAKGVWPPGPAKAAAKTAKAPARATATKKAASRTTASRTTASRTTASKTTASKTTARKAPAKKTTKR
jgi:DNA-binding protein HU-beta